MAEPVFQPTEDPLDELSIPRLQKSLDQLEAQATSVMECMSDILLSQQPQFKGTFENVKDVHNNVTSLQSDLHEFLRQAAAADSICGTDHHYAAQKKTVSAQIANVQSLVDVLRHLDSIKSSFEQIDALLANQGAGAGLITSTEIVCTVSDQIAQLESMLESSSSKHVGNKGEAPSNSYIVRALRSQCRRKKNNIRANLERAFSQAFVTNVSERTVQVRVRGGAPGSHSSGAVPLYDILKAMDQLGMLHDKLVAPVAEQFMAAVFGPLLRFPSKKPHPSVEVDVTDTKATMTVIVPASHIQAESEARTSDLHTGAAAPDVVLQPDDLKHMFDQITKAVRFMEVHVMGTETRYLGMVAKGVWGTCRQSVGEDKRGNPAVADDAPHRGLANKLLYFVQCAIPNSVQLIEHCYQIQRLAEHFETALVEIGFLGDADMSLELAAVVPQGVSASPTAVAGRLLTPYVRNIEEHFAQMRRTHVLGEARRIVQEEYHNSLVVTDALAEFPCFEKLVQSGEQKKRLPLAQGPDYSFHLPPMKVSITVQRMLKLVHQTFREAADSSTQHTRCAVVLYHTARDAFLLFRTLMPKFHGQELCEYPGLSMLFHNDCLYMVHHLATIAHHFRQDFDEKLRASIITVDMIPAFRDEAKKQFGVQVEQQKQTLGAMLDETPRFDTHPLECTEIETGVNRVIAEILKVSHSWGSILSVKHHRAIMGDIVNFYIERVLEQVNRLSVVDAKDVHHYHFFFHTIASSLFDIDTESKARVSIRDKVASSAKLDQLSIVFEPHVTAAAYQDLRESGKLGALSEDLKNRLERVLFSER